MYNHLSSLGVDVKYILHENDIRMSEPHLYDVFSKLNLVTVRSLKDIPRMISKKSLLVSRFAYKGSAGDVAAKVRSDGASVFMYDPSGIDIRVRQAPADYLSAKSESLRLATIKKFPKAYKDIFATGTIHYDAAATTVVDRDEFMRSYDLDPKKNLLLLTPANPGEAWMPGIQDDYKEIVNIVTKKCPGYEIAIKCHPMDYVAGNKAQPGIVHKNQHYSGKGSWEVIAPDLKLVKPEEGYMAIKACDAVLNIRSSLAIEVPMFGKPLININRHKYVTNWPYESGTMMDIDMVDLESVLNTASFYVDSGKCKEYVKRECFSGDGKAYVRTADSIVGVV